MMKKTAFQRRTRIQNILLLLIESGAIYCTMQALYAVLTLLNIYGPVNNDALFQTFTIVSALFTLASAWYPISVVILVNMEDSSIIESFHHNQTITEEDIFQT
ncbi:hypothetical protein GYMLUDRAFT_944334 [Collybiopsis luxurians FD-317 M1]|uniref:Uncharacterized protein n=1 Tax=Collybiopsis luxurians FD-317 M1 TaxID=944289 RepID=A0A0D0BEK8_9AGAR|nr:hypothetical protein GYMLUDRAFT_944334 [Collybiopsis luxurians FD-317 M1]